MKAKRKKKWELKSQQKGSGYDDWMICVASHEQQHFTCCRSTSANRIQKKKYLFAGRWIVVVVVSRSSPSLLLLLPPSPSLSSRWCCSCRSFSSNSSSFSLAFTSIQCISTFITTIRTFLNVCNAQMRCRYCQICPSNWVFFLSLLFCADWTPAIQ